MIGHGNGDLIGNYVIRSVGKRHPAAGLLTTTTTGAIHEWGVELDERDFFETTGVYWKTVAVHSHRFLKIQFPAIFLLNLLRRSIDAYKRELLEPQKLPRGVWTGSRLSEDFLDRRSTQGDSILPRREILPLQG